MDSPSTGWSTDSGRNRNQKKGAEKIEKRFDGSIMKIIDCNSNFAHYLLILSKLNNKTYFSRVIARKIGPLIY